MLLLLSIQQPRSTSSQPHSLENLNNHLLSSPHIQPRRLHEFVALRGFKFEPPCRDRQWVEVRHGLVGDQREVKNPDSVFGGENFFVNVLCVRERDRLVFVA